MLMIWNMFFLDRSSKLVLFHVLDVDELFVVVEL